MPLNDSQPQHTKMMYFQKQFKQKCEQQLTETSEVYKPNDPHQSFSLLTKKRNVWLLIFVEEVHINGSPQFPY